MLQLPLTKRWPCLILKKLSNGCIRLVCWWQQLTHKVCSLVDELPDDAIPFASLGIDDPVQVVRDSVKPEPETDDVSNRLKEEQSLTLFLLKILVTIFLVIKSFPASIFCCVVFCPSFNRKLFPSLGISVTRLGDFLHFGQLFQAFGNN